jgi:hypothetical protein
MTTAPMNPLAGPSGPGMYSTRTDKLDMGSTSYGEGKETAAIKSGAPLATTPDTRPTPAAEVREAAVTRPVGLFAESQRPNEEITVGVDIGPGEGSTALGMNKIQVKLSDTLASMLPFDTTGEIAVLYQEALAQGN